MITKQFFKSSLIYSIVGALPYASGFLLIPWFMELLTPAQFGINALYISLMYFIQIIAAWGFDVSVGVLFIEYNDNRQKMREFLGTVLIVLVFSCSVTALFFITGGIRLFDVIFGSGSTFDLIPFGIFTVVSGVLNGIFKVYSNLLIYQQRPERFLWINLLNFLLTIGFSLGIVYSFPFTLYGPILGRMIPACFSAALSVILLSTEYGTSWNKEYAIKLIKYSSPLVIFALLSWIVNYIDRFLVLRVMGDTTLVGIYDFSVKLILGIDLIQIGLISSMNPKIFTIWKTEGKQESTPEVNRYYSSFTAINLLLIPLFVFLAPLLIPIIIHKEIYFEAFGYLAILGAGYATRTWYYMSLAPVLFYKKTQVLPRVFLYSAIFEIAGSTALIYFLGLPGAAIANFLVKPVQAFFMFLESRKVFRFKVNKLKILFLPILFILVVLCSEWLATDVTRNFIHAGQLLISITLVWLAYRKEISPMMRKILNRG